MKLGKKFFSLFHLVYLFLIEFLLANFSVAYTILFTKPSTIHPKIVTFNTELLTKFEAVILSQMITLTPGTIAAKIDEEKKVILIHILDGLNTENTLKRIEVKMLNALIKVTR